MITEAACLMIVATLGVVLGWSGLAAAAEAATRPREAAPSDRRDRLWLALMLAPAAVGALAAAISGFAPTIAFSPPNLEAIAAEAVDSAQAAIAGAQRFDWLRWSAFAATALYMGVAGFRLVRMGLACARLQWIAAGASPAAAIAPLGEAAPGASGASGADVVITGRPAPAFAALSGRIVVPAGLAAALEPNQLAMVVAHERAHVRRGDAWAFVAFAVVDAVFWFSPFITRQTTRCRLAAEIACDAAVTAQRDVQPSAYARTLMDVLKHGARCATPFAPALFATGSAREHETRLRRILAPTPPGRAAAGARALAAFAVLAAPLAVAQVAIAQSTWGAPAAFTAAPVASGRVVSVYGARSHPMTERPEFNRGVILATPAGAVVRAPAEGRVALIADHPDGVGLFVMIAHPGGFASCYGPFRTLDVAVGDVLAPGDPIAALPPAAGGSAPLVYIEVLRRGRPLDPATVLTLPDAAPPAAAPGADS